MTFGERLRTARKNADLSQVELGQLLGVANTTISNWEKDISEPSLDMIEKLCGALNVSPNTIISDTVDITFDDFTYAMFGESRELTGEEKQTLLDMARFLKSQKEQRSD